MAKSHFRVQPQRQWGNAWMDCEPHRAQRWAVIDSVGTVHTRRFTKQVAENDCVGLTRNAEGPPRRYVLGKRMPSYRTDKEV